MDKLAEFIAMNEEAAKSALDMGRDVAAAAEVAAEADRGLADAAIEAAAATRELADAQAAAIAKKLEEAAAAHAAGDADRALAADAELASHGVDSLRDALGAVDGDLGKAIGMMNVAGDAIDRMGADAGDAGAKIRAAFVAADDAIDDAVHAFERAGAAISEYDGDASKLVGVQEAVRAAVDSVADAVDKSARAMELATGATAQAAGADRDLGLAALEAAEGADRLASAQGDAVTKKVEEAGAAHAASEADKALAAASALAAAAATAMSVSMGAAAAKTTAAAVATKSAGQAAWTAAGFWARWGNVIHWVVAGSAELLAVAIPAMVAFGAAMADAAQGAQMVDEHMTALWDATEATGNMFGISAGQALGFADHLQAAQNAANPQVYEALGGALDGIGGKFSSFAAGSDQALTKVKAGFGGLAATGNQALEVMDRFIAHMQLDLVEGTGAQVSGLLSHMIPDLTQLGAVFGNLGHAVLNVAADMPGLAEVLLRVADGIATAVKWATQLGPVSHYIIEFAMAFEEAGRWGQVLVNILGKVGLATKIVEDTSKLGFFAKIGAGVKNLAATIGGILPKAIGGAVSGIGALIGKFGGLDPRIQSAADHVSSFGEKISAVTKNTALMGWIGAGVAALVVLGVQLDRTRNTAQQFIDTLNQSLANVNDLTALTMLANGIARASSMIEQQETILHSYSGAMQSSATTVASWITTIQRVAPGLGGAAQGFINAAGSANGFSKTIIEGIPIVGAYLTAFMHWSSGPAEAAAKIDELTVAQKKWESQSVNVVQGAQAISKAYGTDFVGSLVLAQQAGVNLTTSLKGMSAAAVENRLMIANLIAGYQAMGQDNSAISGDMDVLAVQSGLAASKVQQLTQATEQYMQEVTGGTAGLAGYVQSLENLGSVVGKAGTGIGNLGNASSISLGSVSKFAAALKNMGGQGAQAWTNFDQVMGQTLPNLIGWFQTAGAMGIIGGQKMKQGMLDALSGIVPYAQGNKAAEASVLALARTNLGTSLTWGQLTSKIKDTHASMAGANTMVQELTVKMGNLEQVAQNLGDAMASDISSTLDKAELAESGLGQESDDLASKLLKPGVSADSLRGKAEQMWNTIKGLSGGSKVAADNFLHAWLAGFGKTGDALWKLLQQTQKQAPQIPGALEAAADQAKGPMQSKFHALAAAGYTGVTSEDLPGKMRTTGEQSGQGMHSGLASQTPSISGWGKTIIGVINASLGGLPGVLLDLGARAAEGLASGLMSKIGEVASAAASLAAAIPGKIMGFLETHSPSRVMMRIGADVASGLALGITNGIPEVMRAAHDLADAVPGGLAVGTNGVPLAWEAQMIGKDTVRELIAGLTGSKSQITAAIKDITDAAKRALQSGLNNAGTSGWKIIGDLTLLSTISDDNKKLQALADQRTKIMKEIKAAEQYAASVTSSMESEAGIGNLTQPTSSTGATLPWTAADISSGLTSQLKQLQAFDHNIDVLRKMGLSKQLIAQIVAAGYQQGGALAQALAHGSEAQIKSLNATEAAIIKASKKIGKDSADSMYDAGKDAGKGFLSGLKAEEKAIDAEMKKIADDIVKAIRKALRAKSPSMEMHDVGMDAALGLANGLRDGTPLVVAAARRMAEAVSSVKVQIAPIATHPLVPATVPASGGGGAPVVIVHQHIAGSVLSQQQLQQHTQTAVLQYAHRNQGNGLFLQGRASGAPVH